MSTISVIMPVFNGERYLAQALESIRAQTSPPAEIIVVNDGSTDRSAEIASSFTNVRLLDITHSGVGGARNRGVDAATGDMLAFLDADDVWTPLALEVLLPPLLADPQLEAVFGAVEHFVSEDCPEHVRETYFVRGLPGGGRLSGAMLIRKDSFLRVGPFDEGRTVEFVGWYMRAQAARLRMATIESLVLRRRIHGNNLTIRNKVEAKEDYLSIVRDSLARRRSGGRTP